MSVYFIQAENGLIKIGRSKHPEKRFRALKTCSPLKLKLLKVLDCNRKISILLETNLHNRFIKYRVHGEWFEPGKELLSFIEIGKIQFIDETREFFDTILSIKVTKSLDDEIKRQADELGMSVSSLIRSVLEYHFKYK